MILTFPDPVQDTANYYYRIKLPVRYLRKVLPSYRIEVNTELTPRTKIAQYNWAYSNLYYKGVLIAGVEDNPYDLPSWLDNLAQAQAESYTWADWLSSATLRTATTMPLAKRINANQVLPNLIDLDDFPSSLPSISVGSPVTILWAGSNSHRGDLDVITSPVLDICKEFKDQVQVIFWGCHPPNAIISSPCWRRNIFGMSWGPFSTYYKTLLCLRPAIGLCPLLDHPFNQCKSPIKFMEYTIAGAAVIASPVEPYRCITESTGRIAGTPMEWYENLRDLILHPGIRKVLHHNALLRVKNSMTWQTQSNIWENFYLDIRNLFYGCED